MADHKYILEPYKGRKSRYNCPICSNRQKTFTRYVYSETGEYLADHVGKCDRDNNCGYHYPPRQYFADNPNLTEPHIPLARARIVQKTRPVSYIPTEIFKASLSAYDKNYFIHYLHSIFGEDIAGQLAGIYRIGSSKHWNGATVFWQIDTQGRVRTGKVMLYNPNTGKRVKEPHKYINWVHALKDSTKNLMFPDYQLKQCLFGEHLLAQYPAKPIALVESEKTAIIASVYLPQYIWLATGGKEAINEEKCKVLQSRRVVLYPDLKCYDKWIDIKKMLVQVSISNFLEQRATEEEKAQGLDIADYLLRYDYRAFHKTPVIHAPPEATEEQDVRMEAIDINTVFDNHINTKDIAQTIFNTSTPFEGYTGRIYLPTPGNPSRYAVYGSIVDYNKRRHLPEYVDKPLALQDRCKDLVLDYKELQLKHTVP